jgi:hypothetical protein
MPISSRGEGSFFGKTFLNAIPHWFLAAFLQWMSTGDAEESKFFTSFLLGKLSMHWVF